MNASHPWARQAAVIAATLSLLITAYSVNRTGQSASVPRAMTILLRDGEFALPDDSESVEATHNLAAQTTVELLFRSADYVYVVKHRQSDRSVIILPTAEAVMSVELPVGSSHLDIVQGCGQFSDPHRTSMILVGQKF